MGNLFKVKYQQPKDVPFQKSKENQEITKNKYQNVGHLTSIVILICMSTFYYGITLSMTSAVTSAVYKKYFGDWASGTLVIGWLVGLYHIGGAFGALSARPVMKYLTRKQFLIAFDILAIIVTGIIQVNNIALLMVMRVLQGFVVGAFMAMVPLYINQITPVDLRGSQGMLSMIGIVFGVVLDYAFKVAFVQSHANTEAYWRFVFGFTGLPVIIQLIAILTGYVPQSPMSLIEKGKMDEAKSVLALFNIPQVLNDTLAEMIRDAKQKKLQIIAKTHGITPKKSKQENQKALTNSRQRRQTVQSATSLMKIPQVAVQPKTGKPVSNTLATNTTHRSISLNLNNKLDVQLGDISTGKLNKDQVVDKSQNVLPRIIQMYNQQPHIQPQVRRILTEHHLNFEPVPHVQSKVPILGIILGFQLHFMQQFSGIKMNVTQTSVIFQPYNADLSIYAPFIANIAQFVGSFLSIPILARYGRRISALGGNLILGLINLCTAIMFVVNDRTQNETVINIAFAFICLFMVGYAASIGAVIWVYVIELIPSSYVPFASSMNWLSAAISVIATPYVLQAVGSPYPVFFFFGGILMIFFIINQRYLIQTRGLTHDQIVAKLQEKVKN